MRSRRADVGRAGLLLLEECRVLSTVARGQRLSWLLRKDHHGTEHGGRHRRELGFEYASLEQASEKVGCWKFRDGPRMME
jgi:hypothetical protein